MKLLFYILAFIVLTTANFEYLINRQSSTFSLLAAVVLEIALVYVLIIPYIKKLLR